MSLTDLVCHVSAHLDARESPGDHSVEADHISSMVQSSEDDIEYLAEFQPLELSGSLGHGGEILSESHLHQRLDRWLVNAHQCLSFMEAFVTHLDRLGSNHQPLLVSLKEDENDGISRPFRFINAWQSHPDFHGFLETVWEGTDVEFWRDVWIADVGQLLNYVDPNVSPYLFHVSVASTVIYDGEWNWRLVRHLLPGILCYASQQSRGRGMARSWMWSDGMGQVIFASLSSRHTWPVVGKGVDQIICEEGFTHYKCLPRVKYLLCVESFDDILRRCPQALLVWKELIIPKNIGGVYAHGYNGLDRGQPLGN
ncbi:hypothetical protein V6N13_133631 [Hibiscus sabdariffa]